ncbi:MAG TPA: response regulator [Thermoanaerobaculia bacterium]|jgi:CheY-like chemotaxis protein
MPKKILLADDSITIQKVVELTFSDGDYEVTAVNNGAKAVQKLADLRPDIILSDIIMPEKNGYEVCEYVKSHPDFRNIPVVLLTGTFEPFDPDRAEKAGCDAVVTKPFESQSLIHKVEELIAQAQSASAAPAAAAPEAEPAVSPWMDDAPAEPASSFSTAYTPPPAADAFTHDADIFGAAPSPAPTTEMPFELPPAEEFSGETRAFPRMTFDEMQQMSVQSPASIPEAAAPPPPPAPEPAPAASPWDEPAGGGFDFASPAPEPEAESPFGAPPPAEEFSGETRAFPRMTFDDLQQMANAAPAAEPAPEPPPAAASPFDAPSPFDEEPDAPAFGGETRAFPKMSFDDLQQMAASTPPPAAEQEPAPWGDPVADDTPAFGGETRAFPKLSFDDFAPAPAPAAEPEVAASPEPVPDFSAPEPAPWSEPAAEDDSPFAPREVDPVESLWAPTAEPAEDEPPVAASPFAEPMPEDLPFAADTTPAPEPDPAPEQSWAPLAAAEAAAEPDEPVVPPPALAPDAPPMAIAARNGELSDDQVDRIARRVVELMSDQVVRNIAWEVIPDLAEMVVKERIRQLESEA